MSKTIFERRGGENEEKNLGFTKKSGFGWVCFPFLAPKRSSNLQEEI